VSAFGSIRVALFWCSTLSVCFAQAPGIAPALPATPSPQAAVTGIYNWIHGTADLDRGYAFYHNVFGIELAPSPFGAQQRSPNAPPEKLRSRAEAATDPLVGNLTNTGGARFRNAFMKLPNTEFGLELSEFNGIEQRTEHANLWDPGACTLILYVRKIDSVWMALKTAQAPIITVSGKPVRLPNGARSLFTRDPDGFLIQVVESPGGSAGGDIVTGTAIGLTIADWEQTLRYYRDLLGFKITSEQPFTSDKVVLDLMGLKQGEFRNRVAYVPGTSARVEFYEFKGVAASPKRWRIQDPGSPQLQLQVADLDPLIERTKAASYRFVSVGAAPIQRPVARFIFTEDPNGVLVEFVHPNRSRAR